MSSASFSPFVTALFFFSTPFFDLPLLPFSHTALYSRLQSTFGSTASRHFLFLFSSHFPTFLSFSSFLHFPPFPLSHYDTGTCRTGCNVSPCKHTLSIHFTSTSFSFSHLVIFPSAHIFSLRCHLIETPEVCLSACIKWILCHRVQILNINNIPLCVAWVSEH